MKDDIIKLIEAGESINIEFKESKTSPTKDVYQTICAFLNRIGGYILLGVKNNGEIIGVNPENVSKIKKEIVTSANNPQKINPPVSLMVDDIKINDKTIILITVPESSQVHRCNGKIYDRNEDGDFDITNNNDAVAMLYMKKQSNFSENKVYPFLTLKELNEKVIEKVKKMIKALNPNSPLPEMDNFTMLKSLGFYQEDVNTGKTGFTLGALLLFGKDEVIYSTLAYYKTDAIVRIQNIDRYDDREIVNTNLIDAFEILMQFIRKHLPDPFYLEDNIHRLSLRDKIFREVISNILMHREYLSPLPARLIIEKTKVITENANRTHGYGHITPDTLVPYSKNPKIARVFREIGRADELGSGVRNIFKYTPIYSRGGNPELIEKDVFKIIIPLVPDYEQEISEKTTRKSSEKIFTENTDIIGLNNMLAERVGRRLVEKVGAKLVESQIKILLLVNENPKITKKQMAEAIGISTTAIDKNIEKLKGLGILKRIGPDRGGYWKIVKNEKENND